MVEVRVSSRNKKIVILLAVLVVGAAVIGFGAGSTGQETADTLASETDFLSSDGSNSLDTGSLFLRMMSGVAIVAVLAVATLYVSKKVLPKVTHTNGKEIRVVETTYLGPRKALHLVQVGNQKILVGSTGESITTLAHIDDAWLELSKQEVESAVNL